MLAEFLNALSKQARQAGQPQVVDLGDPRQRHLVVDGVRTTVGVPPPLRHHELHALDSLLEALVDSELCDQPEVFHNAEAVVVACNRMDRRDFLRMPLIYTAVFNQVLSMRMEPVSGSPKSIVRWLRFTLGAPPGSERLIAGLRTVDFERTSSGRSHVEHGKESLGKSIEARVQQADNIPEEVTLRVRLYQTQGVTWESDIRFGVELDPEQSCVRIHLLPDQIAVAINAAQAWLREQIASSFDEALYHGKY